MSLSLDDIGNDIGHDGRVRGHREIAIERRRKGLCETCGRKCFKKGVFSKTPITDPGRVENGRCLKCHPLEVTSDNQVLVAEVNTISPNTFVGRNHGHHQSHLSHQQAQLHQQQYRQRPMKSTSNVSANSNQSMASNSSYLNASNSVNNNGHSSFNASRGSSMSHNTGDRTSINSRRHGSSSNYMLTPGDKNTSSRSLASSTGSVSTTASANRGMGGRMEKAPSNRSVGSDSTANSSSYVPQEVGGFPRSQEVGTLQRAIIGKAAASHLVNNMRSRRQSFLEDDEDPDSYTSAVAPAQADPSPQPPSPPVPSPTATAAVEDQNSIDEQISSNNLELIIKTMQDHPEDLNVQSKACEALSVYQYSSTDKATATEVGGIEVILNCMINFSDNIYILEHSFQTMIALCEDHDSNRTKVAESGGIEIIVGALQVHRDEVNVQELGAWTMSSLIDNTDLMIQFAEAGGLDFIIRAMWVHPNHMGVQKSVMHSLKKFTSAGMVNVNASIVEIGGITAIVNSMHAHTNSNQIQMKGCECFANLARSDNSFKARLVEEEALDPIVMAMFLHGEDGDVLEKCCEVLKEMAIEETFDAFLASNVVDLMADAARKFPTQCQEYSDYVQRLIGLV